MQQAARIMRTVRISHLLQVIALCLGLYLLYLYVRGGQQHPQPGSGELDKLRDEAAKLRDEAARLRDEAVKLQDEAAKLQEQMSAQNEMNKKVQDQDWALQSKIDKMQDDLHDCRTESGKHGELVQGLERSLENCEGQNSNLGSSLENCQRQSRKSQDNNIWWLIVPFVLGWFLGCSK